MRRGAAIGDKPSQSDMPPGAVVYNVGAPTPTASFQACDGSEGLWSVYPATFKVNAPVGPSIFRTPAPDSSLTSLSAIEPSEPQRPFVVSSVLYWANLNTAQWLTISADGVSTLSKAGLGELNTAGVKNALGLIFCNNKFWSVDNNGSFSSSSNAGRRVYSCATLNGTWVASTNSGTIVFERFNNSSTWGTMSITGMVTDGSTNFVVVGSDHLIATSPDSGATWTRRKGGLTGDPTHRSVIYNGTEFVAYKRAGYSYIPSANLATLTDFLYSSNTTLYPGSVGPVFTFKLGSTYFGWDPFNANTCYWTSGDGKAWTKATTAFNVNAMCYDAALDRIYSFTAHASAPTLQWMPGNGGVGGSWTTMAATALPVGTANEVGMTVFAGRILFQVAGAQVISYNDQSLWYDFPAIAAIGSKNAFMRIK